jgi:hypothetical protein
MSAYEAVRSALEYQFSQLIDETGHDAMDRAARVAVAAVGAREEILSRAIDERQLRPQPEPGGAAGPDHRLYVAADDVPADTPELRRPERPGAGRNRLRLARTQLAERAGARTPSLR